MDYPKTLHNPLCSTHTPPHGFGGSFGTGGEKQWKRGAIAWERQSYVPKCLKVSGLHDSHITGTSFFNRPLFLKRQIHCLPSSSIQLVCHSNTIWKLRCKLSFQRVLWLLKDAGWDPSSRREVQKVNEKFGEEHLQKPALRITQFLKYSVPGQRVIVLSRKLGNCFTLAVSWIRRHSMYEIVWVFFLLI